MNSKYKPKDFLGEIRNGEQYIGARIDGKTVMYKIPSKFFTDQNPPVVLDPYEVWKEAVKEGITPKLWID